MPKKWKFLTENERAARARELKLKKSYERIKATPLVPPTPIDVDFDADADATLPYVPDTLPAGKLAKVPLPTVVESTDVTIGTKNDVRSSKKRTHDGDDAQTTKQQQRQQQQQQQRHPQQQKQQQRHQPEQTASLGRKHTIVVEKQSNANDDDDDNDIDNKNDNDNDNDNDDDNNNDNNDDDNRVSNDSQDRRDDNEDSDEAAYQAFKKRRMSELSGEVRKLSDVKNDRFLQARKAYAAKQLEALDRRFAKHSALLTRACSSESCVFFIYLSLRSRLRGEFNAMQRARRQRERKTKRALMSRRSTQGQVCGEY